MAGYRDLKFSTLIDKMNKGIRATLDTRDMIVSEKDYGGTIARIGTDLLRAWGYPLRLSYRFYEFAIRTADHDGDEHGILVAELIDRYERSKGRLGERTKRFKRFMKSGPCFEDKVSTLVARRKSGVTFRADDAAWEIQKLGYSSPDEFIDAYNKAKKMIDDAFGVWHRYEILSEEEKAAIQK